MFNQGELIPSLDEYYSFRPTKFDTDSGSTPTSVVEGGMTFAKFIPGDDTVLYTDIPLDGLYSKDLPLNLIVFFRMDTGMSAGTFTLISDYAVSQIDGSVNAASFTNVRTAVTVTADTNLRKFELAGAIPAMTANNPNGVLTLRIGRGATGTSTDSLLLFSTMIYQGDLS